MACQSFVTLRSLREGTMGLIYIIICLLCNDEVHSSFQVKKFLNKFSWETAKHTCNRSGDNLTIAVPRVELCSLKVLEKLDLKGEAWVGYFQTYEYFMFIACVPLSEIERSVSEKFKFVKCENRPGMCYSVCGLRGYIGLLDDVCYCIVQRNFSTPGIKGDNTSCEDPLHCVNNGMLCGNREYNKISVYNNVAISSNDIKGNGSGCLVVTKGRKFELSVANCSDRFHHLCESYYRPMLYLEESPSNDQWVYSFRDCIKTSKKPTTFIGDSTTFIFPTINGSWWTSVVRDLVVRNYSESMIINETSVYQGFLRNSAEGTKLDFIHVRNSLRMTSVACMSEQASTEQGIPSIKQAGTTIMSAATEGTKKPLIYADESLERSYQSPQFTNIPCPRCDSKPADCNVMYGLVGVSVMLLGAVLIIIFLVFVIRRLQVSQEHVQELAAHNTREQHALLEMDITDPPSVPPIQICTKKEDHHSSYLTVIFDREGHDVAFQQPCS